MNNSNFDLVIIGAGQAASPLARDAVAAGWKVAVIEEEAAGGSCVNSGCTPTKTLIASARVAHLARESLRWGIKTQSVSPDWQAIRSRRDKMVDDFRSGSYKGYTETKGLSYIEGTARFTAPLTLEIKSQRDVQQISGKRIVVNVGTEPFIPQIPGLDGIHWVDSAGLQKIEKLPEHLVVVGGGYVGVEFAQMFRRFGCRVSIVHHGKHLLSREDSDIASEMEKILREEGIEIFTGSVPGAVKGDGSGFEVSLESRGSKKKADTTLSGDLLLVAAGRRAPTKRLNVHAAGINTDKAGFISVDDSLATSAENVWAVGDCKGGPAFTHISYDDYRVLSDIFLDSDPDHVRNIAGRPVPYTVFTDPQLGRIGLSEQDARKQGVDFEVFSMPFSWVARGLESGETAGIMKVLRAPSDHRILGGAVLGMEGGEMASMLQLAMAGGLSTDDLANMIFPHPGLAEAFNNLFSPGNRRTTG